MENSVFGSTGWKFFSACANTNGLKTASGFGVINPSNPVMIERGSEGVSVMEGVFVMVGVKVTVRVNVTVGVKVTVGVSVTVGVGG